MYDSICPKLPSPPFPPWGREVIYALGGGGQAKFGLLLFSLDIDIFSSGVCASVACVRMGRRRERWYSIPDGFKTVKRCDMG